MTADDSDGNSSHDFLEARGRRSDISDDPSSETEGNLARAYRHHSEIIQLLLLNAFIKL